MRERRRSEKEEKDQLRNGSMTNTISLSLPNAQHIIIVFVVGVNLLLLLATTMAGVIVSEVGSGGASYAGGVCGGVKGVSSICGGCDVEGYARSRQCDRA